MAIVGLGVDAVDVDRFRRVLERRPALARRVFTDAEQAYAASSSDPTTRLAVRFAAKEAALKSMGGGIGSASFRDVEVVRGKDGAPHLALGESAAALARRRGISHFHVSLTHTDTVAVASVVAESLVTAPEPFVVIPVVTVAEMRAIDDEARRSVSLETLVDRAGTALATVALGMLGGGYGRRVVVLCGKGNNGADGRVAAAKLRRRGARVEVIEAATAPTHIGPAETVHLVIDAAYGTGFRGSYVAPAVPAGISVLAADIASGVDGDTGEACGEPLRADVTVTFAALKPGLLQADGAKLSGRIVVADIGLDAGRAAMAVVEDDDVTRLLTPRPAQAHKWLSAVAVVAGSAGMTGAATLCARAAYRAGAGMVRLGIPGADSGELPTSEAVAHALPAGEWVSAALALADRCKVLVIGPGLGRSDTTVASVRELVTRCPLPVVVDADGLFALGHGDALSSVVGASGAPRVLTPHDGEFTRLAGKEPGPDRIAAARRMAAQCGAVVLLKGSVTMVAGPDGDALVSTAGSPRLATAGTGDVLSGIIGAFVARGVAPLAAAALGAHVHGSAAELGPSEGLVAGDVVDLVAQWLSAVCRG